MWHALFRLPPPFCLFHVRRHINIVMQRWTIRKVKAQMVINMSMPLVRDRADTAMKCFVISVALF